MKRQRQEQARNSKAKALREANAVKQAVAVGPQGNAGEPSSGEVRLGGVKRDRRTLEEIQEEVRGANETSKARATHRHHTLLTSHHVNWCGRFASPAQMEERKRKGAKAVKDEA